VKLPGDVGHVESCFDFFETALASVQRRCSVCVKHTIGSLMRTSSTITRWQRRNKKMPSGLVVVGRRPYEPLNNPTLLSLGGGSHLKRESHPFPIGLFF
jgi:hypothetical protein